MRVHHRGPALYALSRLHFDLMSRQQAFDELIAIVAIELLHVLEKV